MAILQSHPICEQATVVETKEFSYDQFFLKVRADLTGQNKFQVRIYYNQGHIDYAYNSLAIYHYCAGTIRRSFAIWRLIRIIITIKKAMSSRPL